jgi:hypothetical protein
MPFPKSLGMESAGRGLIPRWTWLIALYLANLAILGIVCIVLMRYRVFNSLRQPWLCWLIGLADAEVALGVMLAVIGPGPYSIRIPLGIVLTGMGMITNGVVNHVDIQAETSTILQIMFASVMHALVLGLSVWGICKRRHVDFAPEPVINASLVPWDVPIEAQVFDADEPTSANPEPPLEKAPAEAPAGVPRFGILHVLITTAAIALVLALARIFLPEIDWNEVDWAAATHLSPFLWSDITVLCLLPLGVTVVGLWEEGQAQLVVATFAGIATCAVQVAMLGLFIGPGGSLPPEMMIAIDFSRLLILLANTSALRMFGLSLQR